MSNLELKKHSELIVALTEIRKMAMEHPAFYEAAFKERDIDALCEEGGDMCDWTMVAILSDDALRNNRIPNSEQSESAGAGSNANRNV